MRTASLIVSRVPGLSSTMRIVPGSFIGNISYWTVAPSRILLETTVTALFVHIRRRTRPLTNRHGAVLERDGTVVESPRETYFRLGRKDCPRLQKFLRICREIDRCVRGSEGNSRE